MKTRIFILFLFCLFSASLHTYGQTRVLKGTVTGTNGTSFPGVSVVFVNQQNRTIGGNVTDATGKYSTTIPKEAVEVVFSFVGYKSQRYKLSSTFNPNIILTEDVSELQEVTIIGKRPSENPNSPIAKRDVTASVSRLNMEDIKGVQATSIEDALQGRLSNVDIVANSGDPGAGMKIRIRGTTSLNASSEPLIVVDGVPYETRISSDFNFATASQEDFGALADLAPEDIASIEVLKDASATAVWGSRGSNGVILINSKKGRTGKTSVEYSYRYNISVEPKHLKMLTGDQYVGYLLDANFNSYYDGQYPNNSLAAWLNGQESSANDGYLDQVIPNPNYKYYDEFRQNTDWLKLITRNGTDQTHNLAIKGGGDIARYRFSVNYLDGIGTTIGTGLKRLTSALNIDYSFSKKLLLTTNFSISNSTKDGNYDAVRSAAMTRMPNMSPWLMNDTTGLPTNQYFQPQTYLQGSNFNPVASVYGAYANVNSNRIRTSFNLRYLFSDVLSYQASASLDKEAMKSSKFRPQYVTGSYITSDQSNTATESSDETFQVYTTNKLIYKPKFGDDHQFTLMGSVTTNSGTTAAYSEVTSGLSSVLTNDASSGGYIRSLNSGISAGRSIQMLLWTHYIYKDRYIINPSLTYEGNSRFGNAKRWGLFPSISTGWRVSNENFMKSVKFINDFKIRASYGVSGNAPTGNYAYYGQYSSNGSYIDMPALIPSSIQLDKLKWENTHSTDIGFDLFAFKNNFELTFDWYNKTTSDLFNSNSVSSIVGYSSISNLNDGRMKNYGWELNGSAALFRDKDWDIRVNFNFARNRNEIIKLPDNAIVDNYSFSNGTFANRNQTGVPTGSVFGYIYDGIYQTKEQTIVRSQSGTKVYDMSGAPVYMKAGDNKYIFQPGDAKYRDINYDGIINQYDLVYLGNTNPILTGGFGMRIAYKGLAISPSFQYRVGTKIINQTKINTENMYTNDNQSAAVLSRWRKIGDTLSSLPRALHKLGYNWLGSSRFIEDGSFLRLKSLTITYTLPKTIAKKFFMSRFDVFFTGYDLLTFTGYSGLDPEVGTGIDNSITPRPRRFAVGLNVEF